MSCVSKIAVGCDHGGYRLKEVIVKHLKEKGLCVLDMGTFSEEPMDYPDTAYKVARAVAGRRAARGILICKSGIGNCIVANKVAGVRAALCHEVRAARFSRQHNDANILVLGSLFVKDALAKKMVDVWLATPFEGGRHARRLKKIERIEKLCARP
ncbi:MAG: ribose 5-phosphate isomerase B [Candidatus Omnitrophota bacterium]|jgi:ribose 5-phosphate isomerase B|nr:ribose 5-phosphate isomerase B [Candidatus Omnitrophota bacterium]MDD5137899.1 ribose 5-phosphate isomerase B [Candidatus Omnitrophota bacterium]MDD5537892.1 ribose 5-phosphate isomerase B [Candidatus Omnitrophota bacterium]